MDYRALESSMSEAFGLQRRPIAIAFRDSAPSGVEKFAGTEPSGCSFWRIAEGGRTFYTVPGDHYNCAIGSYTHSISLPTERAGELDQTLSLMTGVHYLRMEEVPRIPRLPKTPGAVIYAPLGDTPVAPDVALFIGRPARISLLLEAAVRGGATAQTPFLGRPTCMALPAVLTQGIAISGACIGNRVYTDLAEDELYVAIRGDELPRIAAEAQTIAAANLKLADYHRGRRRDLATE